MAHKVSARKIKKKPKGKPKPVKGSNGGVKGATKKSKKSADSYKSYVYKVLKQIHPELGISLTTIDVMNSFLNDIFESLVSEASRVASRTDSWTIAPHRVQSALRFNFPDELSQHGVSKGNKAAVKFASN